MELKDKIKKQRKNKKMTQTELANYISKKIDKRITSTAVSGWERGANRPTMDKIEIMAILFDKPISYFFDEVDIHNQDSVSIPLLGEIACGEPITASENVDNYIERSTAGLPHGNLYYLKCKGNSMAPTIPDGAYVLIREQNQVEDGEIAAVLVNGDTEATLKRVKKQRNTVMLLPDNSSYEPLIVSEENPARIIGKAMEFTSKL